MTTKLEIERRFLVSLPLSEDAWKQINLFPKVEISQTYIIASRQHFVERVRKTSIKMLDATFNHYYHTRKSYVSSGVSEETEIDINEKRYNRYISKFTDLDRTPIIKDRYLIDWKGKTFELDIFHDKNDGLAILEIELEDLDEEFELPPFLVIEKEITDNKEYSNFNLANKAF